MTERAIPVVRRVDADSVAEVQEARAVAVILAVRDGFDEVVWTLTLTPDNLQTCLGQEAFAEEQPLEEMIDGYLMNTAFLSRIPKEKLREMVSLLESRPARSIIEQTNLSLMRSELKVTEAERRCTL